MSERCTNATVGRAEKDIQVEVMGSEVAENEVKGDRVSVKPDRTELMYPFCPQALGYLVSEYCRLFCVYDGEIGSCALEEKEHAVPLTQQICSSNW